MKKKISPVFQVAQLARAVAPLERTLEVMGPDTLKTIPILTDVVEEVVLATRNLVALHPPEGVFNADAAGKFLAYIAELAESDPRNRDEASRDTVGSQPGATQSNCTDSGQVIGSDEIGLVVTARSSS